MSSEESKIKLGKRPEKLSFSTDHVQSATELDQTGLNNHRT